MMEEKHWYVLRALFRSELKVRDSLRRAGFHCYVPMCYRLETIRGHKIRRLVPAITELVFVYANATAIQDYKIYSKETVYWLTKPNGTRREKIIVPDKAMEDFIRITQENEQSVTYFRPEEINLKKGDRIIIHGGPFDGIEGMLLKMKGKREKKLLVSIPNLIAAAITIKPDMVEPVSQQGKKSINPSRDTKEIIHLSTQLLLSPPDPILQSTEYDLLFHEIKRLYESLYSIREYLPTQEGELVLALLMAESVMKTIKQETIQRFERSLSNLSERSILKLRMQCIGGKILNDKNLQNRYKIAIKKWNKESISERQSKLITELEKWSHHKNYT